MNTSLQRIQNCSTSLHKKKISLVKLKKPVVTLPDATVDEQDNQKTSDNSRILFNNLFRQLEKVLVECQTPHANLTLSQLGTLMSKMNFVKSLRAAMQEQELISSHDILNSPGYGVTVINVFKFILIVCNISFDDSWLRIGFNSANTIQQDLRNKPIGTFNTDGDWSLESHEKLGIRKLFQGWYYNRLSQTRLKTYEFVEDHSYSPEILNRSRKLAEKQRDRVKSFSKKSLMKSDSHEELLIVSKKLAEHKVKAMAERLEKEEKGRCPFKPRTNVRQKSVQQHKDRCLYLYNKSKEASVSPDLRSSVENLQNESLKQCTFFPVNLTNTMKLSIKPLAKDCQSSIQRMKRGLHQRQMSKTMKQRGYPRDVPDWNKFVRRYKKDSEYCPQKFDAPCNRSQVPSKSHLVSIQVQLSGKQEIIDVYEGDSIQNLACKIIVKNNLPSMYLGVVQDMVQREISKRAKIRICDGYMYQLV